MKFTNWDKNHRYGDHTAPGWIPAGTAVQLADGDIGYVVHGNSERVMVEYHPHGGGWQREWFSNSELRVAASSEK